jgi:type IV pilus assembly protein PilA
MIHMTTARKNVRRRGFTLIELMIVVAIVGILAVLAVFGVRSYLSNAKSAEATNTLGQLNKGAVMGYEEEATPVELLVPGTQGSATVHRLCDSANAAVPAGASPPAAKKYLADNAPGADYHKDSAIVHTGFSCLKFEMSEPQQYQYLYTGGAPGAVMATAAGGVVTATTGAPGAGAWLVQAQGDLNGVGGYSSFATGGKIQQGRATPNTQIEVDNPEE